MVLKNIGVFIRFNKRNKRLIRINGKFVFCIYVLFELIGIKKMISNVFF